MTTMLRHDSWKLIVWHGEPACGNARDGELYDLSEDPMELNNLYHRTEFAERRHSMKSLLLAAMADSEDRTAVQSKDF